MISSTSVSPPFLCLQASDFNAERPARRNLQNNTYILGTKFPTETNWAAQEKNKENEKNTGQTVQMNVEAQAANREDTRQNNLLASGQSSNNLLAKAATFMGLSDEEFSKLKGITEQELSHHDKVTDCWVAIYGVVLDVTAFLTAHPGGPAIITSESGRDATPAFKRHPNIAKTEESLKVHVTSGVIKIIGRLMMKGEEKYKKKSKKDKKGKKGSNKSEKKDKKDKDEKK